MRLDIIDKDLGFNKIMGELVELAISDVDVGYFDGEMSADGNMTLAELAQLQMSGSKAMGIDMMYGEIPSRPFMDKCALDNEEEVLKLQKKAVLGVLDQNQSPEEGLKKVGEGYTQMMKDTIFDLRNPPNTKYTLDHKEGDNPLIDSSVMMDSVDFRVR